MTTFVVGQKVRAKKDLIEDACDDHPALLYAHKGEVLVVRSISAVKAWTIYVSHENRTDASFGVTEDEVEAMP